MHARRERGKMDREKERSTRVAGVSPAAGHGAGARRLNRGGSSQIPGHQCQYGASLARALRCWWLAGIAGPLGIREALPSHNFRPGESRPLSYRSTTTIRGGFPESSITSSSGNPRADSRRSFCSCVAPGGGGNGLEMDSSMVCTMTKFLGRARADCWITFCARSPPFGTERIKWKVCQQHTPRSATSAACAIRWRCRARRARNSRAACAAIAGRCAAASVSISRNGSGGSELGFIGVGG